NLAAATDAQAKKQHAGTASKAVVKKEVAKGAGAKKPGKAATHDLKKPAGKAGAKTAKAAPERERSAPGTPPPRPRPDANGAVQPGRVLASAEGEPVVARPSISAPITTTTSQGDLAAVRQALDLIQKGKLSALAEVKQTISDPAALKLIEWCYLRSANS